MRYLLIILFLISFNSNAQVTCLDDSVANWFQERNDMATILEKQTIIQDSLLNNKELKLIFDDLKNHYSIQV